MTFKIADVGNEAQLIEIAERLSDALSHNQAPAGLLELTPEHLDAAKCMLATLSERVAPLPSGTVALTEQQVDTFLDFDPDFLENRKRYASRLY